MNRHMAVELFAAWWAFQALTLAAYWTFPLAEYSARLGLAVAIAGTAVALGIVASEAWVHLRRLP